MLLPLSAPASVLIKLISRQRVQREHANIYCANLIGTSDACVFDFCGLDEKAIDMCSFSGAYPVIFFLFLVHVWLWASFQARSLSSSQKVILVELRPVDGHWPSEREHR